MLFLAQDMRPKNWPRCYPITFHSIEEDIPVPAQRIVQTGYYLWMLTCLALLFNFATCTSLWLSGHNGQGDPTYVSPGIFLWSALFLATGVVGGWKLWYRTMYGALRDDRALGFLWFFLMFLAHTIFSCIAAVGVPSTSTAGVLVMITVWTWREPGLNGAEDRHFYGQAVLCTMTAMLWCLAAVTSLYVLRDMHARYKSRGSAGAHEVKKQVAAGVAKEASGLLAASVASGLKSGQERVE